MKLHELIFTPEQVADLCGVTKQTITRYCRMGILEFEQISGKYKNRIIHGDALCVFLYRHPLFFKTALSVAKDPRSKIVIAEVRKYPKVYTIDEMMSIFQVSRPTIWNWMNRGDLIAYSYECGNRYSPTFRDSNIREFVEKTQRLRIFYTDYNRRTKVS